MTSKDLKKWMEVNDKTAVDVASATKTHPQTVQRFLSGKEVHRTTLEAFRRMVAESSFVKTGNPKSAGT